MNHSRLFIGALLLGGVAAALALTVQPSVAERPLLPNFFPFPNASGISHTYSTRDGIDLTGPFFQDLGKNDRTCASCHLPDQGWSISADRVQARFTNTRGLDPIFRTNDGSNCDHNVEVSTIEGRKQAYSLLTGRGLIRIGVKVPDNAEFDVLRVNNPYGCNEIGVLSMYRRPLPTTNLRFLSAAMWDGRESTPQTGTQKIIFERQNPGSILLADLAHQVVDATVGHAEAAGERKQQHQSPGQACAHRHVRWWVFDWIVGSQAALRLARKTSSRH